MAATAGTSFEGAPARALPPSLPLAVTDDFAHAARPSAPGFSPVIPTTLDLSNGSRLLGNVSTLQGLSPYAVVEDPATQDLLVVSGCYVDSYCRYDVPELGFTVTILNGSTGVPQATFPLGASGSLPVGSSGLPADAIAYDPSSGELFIAANATYILNVATERVVATLPLGAFTGGLAYDPNTGDVYAAAGANVTVISGATNSVLQTFPIGRDVDGIAYAPSDGDLYVGEPEGGWMGNNPHEPIVEAGNVSVLSPLTGEVLATRGLSICPFGLLFDPIGSDVDVAGFVDPEPARNVTGASGVTVLSTATNAEVAQIPCEADCFSGAFSSASGDLYFSGEDAVTIDNATTGALVATVYGNGSATHQQFVGPVRGISVDATDGRVLAAVANSPANLNPLGSVIALSGSNDTVVDHFQVAALPGNVLWDSETGDLYVVDIGTENVTVVDPSTGAIVAQIFVPGLANAPIAVAPSGRELYVIGAAVPIRADSNAVYAIDPANDTAWPVWRPGRTVGDVGVDPVTGDLYVSNLLSTNVTIVDPDSGAFVENLTLAPASPSPEVVYSSPPVYDPADGDLYVPVGPIEGSLNLTVVNASRNSLVASFLCPVAGGDYEVDSPELAYDPTDHQVWANALSGACEDEQNVSSLPSDLPLLPLTIGYDPNAGALILAGAGTVNGTTGDVTALYDPATNTTLGAVGLPSPGATVPSSVAPIPTLGTVAIPNALPGDLAIAQFASGPPPAPTYPVTFTESGLPAGAEWSVTLGTGSNSSSSASVGFGVTNGTYLYSIPSVTESGDRYGATPPNGSVAVNGSAVRISLAFQPTLGSPPETTAAAGVPWVLYGSLVLAAAVALVAAVRFARRRKPPPGPP